MTSSNFKFPKQMRYQSKDAFQIYNYSFILLVKNIILSSYIPLSSFMEWKIFIFPAYQYRNGYLLENINEQASSLAGWGSHMWYANTSVYKCPTQIILHSYVQSKPFSIAWWETICHPNRNTTFHAYSQLEEARCTLKHKQVITGQRAATSNILLLSYMGSMGLFISSYMLTRMGRIII